MNFGLLMESAHAHQKLAESHLERLRAHTQDLDGVVREEIRRTLGEELAELTAESERAAEALRRMKRAADLRGLLWAAESPCCATAIPGAFMHWACRPPAKSPRCDSAVTSFSRERSAARRERRPGGLAALRRYGAALCSGRQSAPAYGDKGDYFVVRGLLTHGVVGDPRVHPAVVAVATAGALTVGAGGCMRALRSRSSEIHKRGALLKEGPTRSATACGSVNPTPDC